MMFLKRLIIIPQITQIENKIPDISNLATKAALNTVENKIPDTSNLIKNTDYNAKITEIEGKIPDISNLATKTALNTVENKISNISGLATKTELTAVENKIPDISNFATKAALTNLSSTVPDINTLIKKSDYDTKILETESEYVSNTGFDSKLVQANVIRKRNFDAKIIEIEKNIKKIQTFDLSYFRGKNYFDEDGTQNCLVFLPISRYFRLITNKKHISSWKSKGLSDETITPYATSDNSLTPWIDYYSAKIRLKFNKSCLKQSNNLTYDYEHKVNVYNVYELGASSSNDSAPTLKKYLCGAVTLTKIADIENYGYSGFGIGFDRRSSFSFLGGGFGQNVLIIRVDMSSSPHIDNKKQDILVLRKGPTQGLESILTGVNSYLFVNDTDIYKFKVKYSEILVGPICLGII